MTDTVNVPREVLERLVAWINREVPVPTRSATRWAMDITDLLAAAPKAEPVSATDDLIDRFAAALKSKLNKAAEKYGYNDDWMGPEWREDLVRHLIAHVEKGDPRDVAAYCAFAWHHGWSVKPEAPKVEQEPDVIIHLEENHTAFGSFPVLAAWKNVSRLPAGKHNLYTHPAPASDELLEAIDMDDFNIVGEWIERGEKGSAPSGRVKGLWQSMRRVVDIAKHKGPQ